MSRKLIGEQEASRIRSIGGDFSDFNEFDPDVTFDGFDQLTAAQFIQITQDEIDTIAKGDLFPPSYGMEAHTLNLNPPFRTPLVGMGLGDHMPEKLPIKRVPRGPPPPRARASTAMAKLRSSRSEIENSDEPTVLASKGGDGNNAETEGGEPISPNMMPKVFVPRKDIQSTPTTKISNIGQEDNDDNRKKKKGPTFNLVHAPKKLSDPNKRRTKIARPSRKRRFIASSDDDDDEDTIQFSHTIVKNVPFEDELNTVNKTVVISKSEDTQSNSSISHVDNLPSLSPAPEYPLWVFKTRTVDRPNYMKTKDQKFYINSNFIKFVAPELEKYIDAKFRFIEEPPEDVEQFLLIMGAMPGHHLSINSGNASVMLRLAYVWNVENLKVACMEYFASDSYKRCDNVVHIADLMKSAVVYNMPKEVKIKIFIKLSSFSLEEMEKNDVFDRVGGKLAAKLGQSKAKVDRVLHIFPEETKYLFNARCSIADCGDNFVETYVCRFCGFRFCKRHKKTDCNWGSEISNGKEGSRKAVFGVKMASRPSPYRLVDVRSEDCAIEIANKLFSG